MQHQKKSTVYQKRTYEAYVLRRVSKSLKSLSTQDKKRFAHDIQKWIDCNGRELTVTRLKDLKQVMMHSASHFHTYGDLPKIDQSGLSSTLAVTASGKILRGYLGDLQKRAIKSSKVLEQVIQLLHAYTLIVDEETTPEDITKLLDIIEPRPEPEHQSFIDDFCNKVNGAKLLKGVNNILKDIVRTSAVYTVEEGQKHIRIVEEHLNKAYLLKKPIGLPNPYTLQQPTQAHENDNFFYEYVSLCRSKFGQDLYEVFPELWDSFPQANVPLGGNLFYPVGRMHLINEGGLKKRWVENTKYIIQYISHPLGERLYELVKYLPWDCTFNESKGIQTIQSALKAGHTCHSVDLSKASDKLPRKYNDVILNKLLKLCPDAKKHLAVFDLIASAHVQLPDISKNFPNYKGPIYTRWGTGQPMGAYPSFATLTLVHGLMLYILNDYKYNNEFVVHGDDVVILDDTLADRYICFLRDSGMEYSEHKTITGTLFAEMNSKLIFEDHVLYPVKWKEINARNCIDMAPFWGTETCAQLAQNNMYSKDLIADAIALPYPLGAGLNPKGLSLEERLAKFPGLIESLFETREANSYYDSYRDLVSYRYSNFAHVKGEMDSEFLQAYLADINSADIADRQCALSNINFISKTNYIDGKWLSLVYLSDSSLRFTKRVSKVKIKSKTKIRKQEQSSRLKNVAMYYCASEMNSDI